jgi:peptide/nickel transport system substrate-binding protein
MRQHRALDIGVFRGGSLIAMRKPMLFAAALAAGALAATGAHAQKDTLTLSMALEPPHLDPVLTPAAALKELLYTNVYEGLTRLDRKSLVQPSLATDWTLSADGLTYTFKLRKGVKFHDGTELTSAAVAQSLARTTSAESANPKKLLLTSNGMTVETPDPATVVIKLKNPVGILPYLVGMGEAVVVAPGAIADAKAKPVGTGPFKFVRWNKGDRLEIEKNTEHWNAANIKLNKATFRFIPDTAATVAALLAGDIDGTPNVGSGDVIDRLKADPKLKVVVGNTEGETILAMNNKKAPLDDVRVRQAISFAIDRKAIIDGVTGGIATPIGTHFSPNHPAYVDLTQRYAYNPERAKALLKEAGKTNLTLSLRLPPPAYAQRSGELVVAMLEQVGIKVQIEQLQFPQWLEQVFRNKQFDLTIISHTEPLDINIYADPTYYFNYAKPEFVALMDRSVAAPTDELRNKIYGDLQRMITEDAVNGYLFMLPKVGAWNAKVNGLWENSPVQANDLTEVSWSN